jgi:hypothetical protein
MLRCLCDLWGAFRSGVAKRSGLYERVPGVRWFVYLHPYQEDRAPQELMDALADGMELRGAETWGELGVAVREWMERIEERILRDRVLAIGDDDNDGEAEPVTWRRISLAGDREELPVEWAAWDREVSLPGWTFAMIRGRQQVTFLLVSASAEAPLAHVPA